ncbi:hypothetical protein ACSBR1_036758 [Camellia fascicularis]
MGFIKGVALSCMKWGQWLDGSTLSWCTARLGAPPGELMYYGVDMFGKRVGFVNFNADLVDKATGKKVSRIVFARGPAVAVLILGVGWRDLCCAY